MHHLQMTLTPDRAPKGMPLSSSTGQSTGRHPSRRLSQQAPPKRKSWLCQRRASRQSGGCDFFLIPLISAQVTTRTFSATTCKQLQTIGALTSDTPMFTTKLRHVGIHRLWLRQEAQSKRISIQWTSTTSILADELTKSLPPQRHNEFFCTTHFGLGRSEGVKTGW